MEDIGFAEISSPLDAACPSLRQTPHFEDRFPFSPKGGNWTILEDFNGSRARNATVYDAEHQILGQLGTETLPRRIALPGPSQAPCHPIARFSTHLSSSAPFQDHKRFFLVQEWFPVSLMPELVKRVEKPRDVILPGVIMDLVCRLSATP